MHRSSQNTKTCDAPVIAEHKDLWCTGHRGIWHNRISVVNDTFHTLPVTSCPRWRGTVGTFGRFKICSGLCVLARCVILIWKSSVLTQSRTVYFVRPTAANWYREIRPQNRYFQYQQYGTTFEWQRTIFYQALGPCDRVSWAKYEERRPTRCSN